MNLDMSLDMAWTAGSRASWTVRPSHELSAPKPKSEKPSSKKKEKSHFRVYFIEPENSILTQWCWVFLGSKRNDHG